MSRFTTIDLSQLPPMAILEDLDVETILNRRMLKLVERWAAHDPPNAAQYDVENLEFDPLKINQEASSFGETTLRDRINQAARAVTGAFSFGSDLDAVASRYPGGLPRLPAVASPRPYAEFPADWETDERYRRRMWLSPNPLSPHGPAGAYEFWALTALSGALRDVSVVKIRPTLADNPILIITCLAGGVDPRPSTAQLLEVRRYITSESRQAMTDEISVQAPKVREIDYRARVWFYPGPDVTTLTNLLTTKVQALIADQYWLGVDHTRAAFTAALKQPGVQNVIVLEPEDTFAPPDWIVKVNKITIEYMGRAE